MINGFVRTYPQFQNILRTHCDEYTDDYGDMPQLAEIMMGIIRQENGMGLAAPQIGIPLRIISIKTEQFTGMVVNPTFTPHDDTELVTAKEGCMSLPTIVLEIERPKEGILRGQRWNGADLEIDANEALSRVSQHEIDHLDGILIIDRVSYVKRHRALQQLKRFEKEMKKEAARIAMIEQRQAAAIDAAKKAGQKKKPMSQQADPLRTKLSMSDIGITKK